MSSAILDDLRARGLIFQIAGEDDLPAWLEQGHRAVRHWYRNYRCATVDFSDQPTAFSNINRPLAGA